MEVRAIKAGEEITVAYCDVLSSYTALQAALELYSFRCTPLVQTPRQHTMSGSP